MPQIIAINTQKVRLVKIVYASPFLGWFEFICLRIEIKNAHKRAFL